MPPWIGWKISWGAAPDGARRRLRPLLLAALAGIPLAAADGEINEGELHFLAAAPAGPVHHHQKHLIITRDSLKTGWVIDRQCHYHLDRVGALEVVFNPERVRSLEITRADNIERAWIKDHSVQLENVGAQAVLCIHSENRALERDPRSGGYILTSGPYMRRFLDGYFPMRVSLSLDYPAQQLSLAGLEPAEIRLKSHSAPGHLRIDALFEGRLLIVARLAARGG